MNTSNKQLNEVQAFVRALPMHVMHDELFAHIDFDTRLKFARALGFFVDRELPKKLNAQQKG